MSEELFNNNIGLVEKIVNKMNYGYVDKEDLFQAGLIGLYKATKKYDEKNGGNFNSFCTIYIISEIKNELRNNKLIKINKKLIKIKRYLNENSNLSLSQVSKKLNVSLELVYLATIHKNDTYSLNQTIDDDELINSIVDENNIINNDYAQIISHLDELSKLIITLKYYKNYSQSEIAKFLNCSQSKVSRIEKNALDLIRKKLL